MIRSSAPGRCGLVGNPTDGYGGTVLSSTLAERASVELHPRDEEPDILLEICGYTERIASEEDLALNGSYADVAKAVLTAYPRAMERPFHLRADTTVPMQAGLAGSTAMLIAILGAVLRALELSATPYEIAESARDIEFNIMNCVCGFQDQYMAVFGGLNCLDFEDKDPLAAGERVFGTVEHLETFLPHVPLLLANTGVQRHSGSVHKGLREQWIEGEPAVVEGYREIARMARDGKVALLSGDWARFGALMNANHAIQRDLGGSGEANERLIAAALDAGALGAKLAGAGKGGTIIALHEDLDFLSQRLEAAGAVRLLPVIPSAGLTVEGNL